MKILYKFLILIALLFIPSCSNNKDVLEVFFFDVNQGDSSFVNYKNTSILIDTGEIEFTNRVVKILKSKKIKRLDYLILSHDHADHVSGFSEIYKNFEIINLILPDTLRKETFNDVEKILKNSKTKIIYIKNPTNLKISNDFNINFLSSFENPPKEFNDSSLVFKLSVRNFDILYTGDVEEDGQLKLLNKNLKSEILKIPHHGAYNNDKNNLEKFFEKVNPIISIISVGNNTYGHPNKKTLSILNNLNSKILRTDKLGNIFLSCNFTNNSLKIKSFF